MHISEVEKARMEKDHKMRNGYQMEDNKKYPHMQENPEHQPLFNKEYENKHARESKPSDYNENGGPV